jgi:pSer/pThr/pTyr-binding forkhead associated (FHA) protein
VRLSEFLERFGALDDAAFHGTFKHPFLLQEGKLAVEGGSGGQRQVFLLRPPPSGALLIGRATTADVSIPDKQVSSKHAELLEQGPRWLIVDRGSTNGTFVDGAKLSPNLPMPLSDASPVRFGPDAAFIFLTAASFLPIFRRMQARQGAEEPRAGVLDAETEHRGIPIHRVREAVEARAGGGRGGLPDMFLCCDGMDGLRLLPGKPVIIGRSPGHATMVLPHGEVSRAHAEVLRSSSGVTIKDLGSANGTFLCGARVGATPVEVPLGKAITIGPFTLQVQGPPNDAGMTIQVDAGALRGVSGDLAKTPLSEVLGEIEAEQKTGVLEVFGGGTIGRVSFRGGQPCNAKTEDGRTGADAIRALIAVKVGTFTLRPDASAVGPKRIEQAFSDLLLEDFLGG